MTTNGLFNYTTYKNGDDWGMVYDGFDHIIWLILIHGELYI